MTADRDAVLGLARRAEAEGNGPLRDLLLHVAGSVRRDGRVHRRPDPERALAELQGPFGVGLKLLHESRAEAVGP